MKLKVLTPSQVEQFIEEGYTLLRDAFPREVAHAVRRAVLEKINAREDDPRTWTGPRNHIADAYAGEPFASALSPRFHAALDDLMGEGRWLPLTHLGWWPVLFPGFDSPPWKPLDAEWHIDGGFFHHHLDSAEQGMLPLFLFSDIGPGDGGTAISVGSHKVTARVLRDAQPAGLAQGPLGKLVRDEHFRLKLPVIELTGNAGDIALAHPFLLHTVSTNTGSKVRVICNPHVDHREKTNVTPTPAPGSADSARPRSPVETAIIRALEEDAAVR